MNRSTLTCTRCPHEWEARLVREIDGEYVHYDDQACPACGHIWGQPVPAWREGYDYEDAERIERAARAKGVTLDVKSAGEIWDMLEAV